MSTKKKILFVNDEMVMGGVARVLNNLLKEMDKDKYEIDLLILHKHGELLKEIPEGVNVLEGTPFFRTVDIPLKQCNLSNIFPWLRQRLLMRFDLIENKIKKERKKILRKQYDVEFAAKEGFCTIFVGCGDTPIKLNWVLTDYKEENFSKNHMGLVKKMLERIDLNIACSDTVNNSYREVFGVDNIKTIYTVVDNEMIRGKSLEPLDITTDEKKINIICVARFHEQKGLDRLIRVYARLKDYYKLTIVGDGALKDELVSLARSLNVYDDITWTGILMNPYPYIRKNDLYVLPSRFEGYPTITIESLISGTPVLALEVAGVKDQIDEEYKGWVIPNDEEKLFEKLDQLKESKTVLLEYKKQLSTYYYDNKKIIAQFEEIFEGEKA